MNESLKNEGRWFVHSLGSEKLGIAFDIFFNGCLSRLGKVGIQTSEYLPWMSSSEFVKELKNSQGQPNFKKSAGVLDFATDFLESIEHSQTQSPHLNLFKDAEDSRIFTRIEIQRPQSVEIFKKAYENIGYWPSWQSNLFRTAIKLIIPICHAKTSLELGNSFTCKSAIGVIFASADQNTPYPDIILNIAFAHELAHHALLIYQMGGDLLHDSNASTYSAIRRTLRPAVSAFHAVAALVYMIECANGLLRYERSLSRIAYLKAMLEDYENSLQLGLNALQPLKTTEIGSKILGDLRLFSKT